MSDPALAMYVRLYHYLGDGLTFEQTLACIADETFDARVSEACRALVEPVRLNGFEMQVLAQYPDLFPPVARTMLWAGCQAGRVEDPIGVVADDASLVLPQTRAALGGEYPFLEMLECQLRFGVPQRVALGAIEAELKAKRAIEECAAMRARVEGGEGIGDVLDSAPGLVPVPVPRLLRGIDEPPPFYNALALLARARSLGVTLRQDRHPGAAESLKRLFLLLPAAIAAGRTFADAIDLLAPHEAHDRLKAYLSSSSAKGPRRLAGTGEFPDLFAPPLRAVLDTCGSCTDGRIVEVCDRLMQGMARGLYLPG